ncbi:hypothetical protein H6P81_012311 [Aristolochia fimbriata]|uniref:Ubiquitin-like domain-containing protein n=1 Tax=Aristolochia fimbriata TaxID=158543 RepID=A0AAV7EBK1_ARIFI|nr:hypothetical protein H6P81_012311 [Aristolochia fimbriata]
MANERILYSLYYDGSFSSKISIYEGGTQRAISVEKMTTVTELKDLIHSRAGIDSSKYDIAVFYRCTLDSPNITPISIIDDVDLEQVFDLSLNESSKVPSLYVVKRNKSSSPRSPNITRYSMRSSQGTTYFHHKVLYLTKNH